MKRILYLLDLLAVVSMIAGCAAIQEETGADELHQDGYLKIFVSIDGNKLNNQSEYEISPDGGSLKLIAYYLDNPEKKQLDDWARIGSTAPEGHFSVTREKISSMETRYTISALKNTTGEKQALGIDLLDTTGFAPNHYGLARIVVVQKP